MNISTHIVEQKTLLRSEMRARRNAISPENGRAFSQRIGERLHELEAIQNANVVAAYLATRHETNLDEAIALWIESKIVVVPSPGLKPRFDRLESLQNVKSNARGLRLSLSDEKVLAHDCDVILVPGLAFDATGNRLGQGGGWYDRTLERARRKSKPVVIGVCFEIQITETVPHNERDQSVDFVITEDRVLDCRK